MPRKYHPRSPKVAIDLKNKKEAALMLQVCEAIPANKRFRCKNDNPVLALCGIYKGFNEYPEVPQIVPLPAQPLVAECVAEVSRQVPPDSTEFELLQQIVAHNQRFFGERDDFAFEV